MSGIPNFLSRFMWTDGILPPHLPKMLQYQTTQPASPWCGRDGPLCAYCKSCSYFYPFFSTTAPIPWVRLATLLLLQASKFVLPRSPFPVSIASLFPLSLFLCLLCLYLPHWAASNPLARP